MDENRQTIRDVLAEDGPCTVEELCEYDTIFGIDDTYITLVGMEDRGRVVQLNSDVTIAETKWDINETE